MSSRGQKKSPESKLDARKAEITRLVDECPGMSQRQLSLKMGISTITLSGIVSLMRLNEQLVVVEEAYEIHRVGGKIYPPSIRRLATKLIRMPWPGTKVSRPKRRPRNNKFTTKPS